MRRRNSIILSRASCYLWCVQNDRRLSKTAKNIIINAEKVYVSSISCWEIAIKTKLGKLDANINELIAAIQTSGFLELPLMAAHTAAILQLPDLHRDPFDRILIAQAVSEPLQF